MAQNPQKALVAEVEITLPPGLKVADNDALKSAWTEIANKHIVPTGASEQQHVVSEKQKFQVDIPSNPA